MNILNRILKPDDQNYRHNVSVFAICLTISVFIWLLTKLTYDYTNVVTFPVGYTGLPQEKIPMTSMDSVLDVAINATGFGLLRINYFTRKRTFNINLMNYQMQTFEGYSEVVIGTSLVAQQIVERFNIPGQVDYVIPESLTLRFNEKVSRRVAVLPDVKYTFKRQYFAYDTMEVKPAYVEISGKADVIEKVRFVKTLPVVFENLDASVDRSVDLLPPNTSDPFWIDPPQVRISMQVKRFTETGFEVSVQPVNLPDSVKIKLFPQKVNISFLVALKDYKDLTPEMFNCVVDFSDITGLEGSRLQVQLLDPPSVVRGIQITPPEIEFLILK
jgi:hypothetical protein